MFNVCTVKIALINNLSQQLKISHWNIVGNAVTIKRPLRPGDKVTSICATEKSKSLLQEEKSSQSGWSALQAGHQGA